MNDPQHPKRAIPQLARFQASATEQEIWCGALSAAYAEQHVIACFREISNRGDFTTAEVKEFFDRTDSGEFDPAAAARQTALKEAVRLRLGKNKPLRIPFSRLKREGDGIHLDASEADTKVYCDAVFEHFRLIIERQIEEYWNKSTQDCPERATLALKIEQEKHQRFGRERGGKETFVGREAELKAIRYYVCNDSPWPLIIHGPSGYGKTALMWRAVEDLPHNCQPIVRFIGATDRSSNTNFLLASLCRELRKRFPCEGTLPIEIKELRDEFDQHLRSATPEHPVILFLDALDQLFDADNGRLLNWIPFHLPPHVKLVVSCLSDRAKDDPAGQPWVELQQRPLPAGNIIALDCLSEVEARTLLFDRWFRQAGRRVSRDQLKRIEHRLASGGACRQPMYLKLLFEEARLWRSYDAVTCQGEDVPAILGQFFERLSQPANHGALLVERVLGYLAASRHGLAENEIVEILFADPEYKMWLDDASMHARQELPASATRIPIAIWSSLRFDLAPYLKQVQVHGVNVITFYNTQVAKWVHEHFLNTLNHRQMFHTRLAYYFQIHMFQPNLGGSLSPNARAIMEYVYQANQASGIEACLTDSSTCESQMP